MPAEHVLTARDKWFLARGMVDPVTKEPFHVGDTVVICTNCKTVHLNATWGMVPNRSCANCGENGALIFTSFSQKLFQAKNVQKKGFRIKEQPLPFYQRIQEMNLYPAAYCTVVLLTVLTALVLFMNLRPAISSGNLPVLVESVLVQFSAETESKGSFLLEYKSPHLLENFREINVESGGNLRAFPTRTAEKLEDVKENAIEAGISGKFRRIAGRLQSSWCHVQTSWHHVRMKLAVLWEAVWDREEGST